jgi:cytochrome P450 family 4
MSATVTSPDAAIPTGTLTASNLFYFLLVPAAILWYAYWRISKRHMLELAAKIPGPPGLPILGNALELIGKPHRKYPNNYLIYTKKI